MNEWFVLSGAFPQSAFTRRVANWCFLALPLDECISDFAITEINCVSSCVRIGDRGDSAYGEILWMIGPFRPYPFVRVNVRSYFAIGFLKQPSEDFLGAFRNRFDMGMTRYI